MKICFLVVDGMGDYPLEELGGKTPLEVADTPNLDFLAEQGLVGICQSVPAGMPPGSDVANMALLGFDPGKYHTGRGPIEAAALGIAYGPDDLIWRLNLVTTSGWDKDSLMLDYSAGHIGGQEALDILERLQALTDENLRLYPGVQYRHILIQKGMADSEDAKLEISPAHDIINQPLGPDLALMQKSAQIGPFADKARELLAKDNPTKANAVWPWGQGSPVSLPNFKETFGLVGGVITAVDLVRGLGRAAGMEIIDVPGATGLPDTNYSGKAQKALEFMEHGDFIFLHLEVPDECSHSGDLPGKIESIRRFDTDILGAFLNSPLLDDFTIVVTCDHFTPCSLRTHSRDEVPFVIWKKGSKTKRPVQAFSEKNAAQTGLKLSEGPQILDLAIKIARGQL